MSWDTAIVKPGVELLILVLNDAGIQTGEPEVVSVDHFSQQDKPLELRRVEFKHAVTGEALVLEEYLKVHHYWSGGDGESYIYDVHVHSPGSPLPPVEEVRE